MCLNFSLQLLELGATFLGGTTLALLFAAASGSCSFLLLPVGMVTIAVNVALRQTEDLKSLEQEVKLGQDVANEGIVSILRVKEEVAGRVGELELLEPSVEKVLSGVLFVECLDQIVVGHCILDGLEDLL